MKKIISLLLSVIMAVSFLTLTVGATDIADKIDPSVREKIGNVSFGGMVVAIRHHNPKYPTEGVSEQDAVYQDMAAQQELLRQIGEFSRYEVGTFSVGVINIGLPYESIEKVAALENVDYITLPEEGCYLPAEQKISDASKEKLSELNDSDTVDLNIWLAYDQQVYIGMDVPDDDIATHEAVDAYLVQNKERRKAYITAKNAEFAERITAAAEAEVIGQMKLFPIIVVRTTADKVMEIAALPEVWTLDIDNEDDSIIEPTEESQTISGKFERYMWNSKRAVSQDDPDAPVNYGDSFEYRNYEELFVGDNWALIRADYEGIEVCWELLGSIIFGDRVLSWRSPGSMEFGLYVYDAQTDTFYPIENVDNLQYEGILDVMNELHIGRPLGDADKDNELTIMDATAIQRDQADLEKLPDDDVFAEFVGAVWSYSLYADADGDGEITVMDATRVQYRIAELEE